MAAPILLGKTCRNCRFATDAPNGLRECRYGPPTANAILAPDGKGGFTIVGGVAMFPAMSPDAFCHRHERGLAAVTIDATALSS